MRVAATFVLVAALLVGACGDSSAVVAAPDAVATPFCAALEGLRTAVLDSDMTGSEVRETLQRGASLYSGATEVAPAEARADFARVARNYAILAATWGERGDFATDAAIANVALVQRISSDYTLASSSFAIIAEHCPAVYSAR